MTLETFLEESATLYFLRCDAEGRIQSCSQALARELGRPPGTLLGTPIWPWMAASDEEQWRGGGMPGSATLGGIECRVGRLEEGFVLLGEAAPEADQLKSQFLANISHEFRTPLNAVMGMAHLLQKTSLNLQQREYLRHILGGSEALARLVQDLLDFSASDAGRLELRTSEFQLETLGDGLLRQVEAEAQRKGLKLSLKLDPEVPTRVLGDPLRLHQLLLILLENGVKFTVRGEVSLSVQRLADSAPNRVRLSFQVRDSGPGFAPGEGLGLALCRRLVDLMQGQIEVESEPGHGSLVTVNLEFSLSKPALELGWASTRTGGPGERVLVVEDNQVNQMIVYELLQRAGLQVDLAANGREALQKLETAQPCPWRIVLMDLQMPEMDGYTATRAIRGQSRFQQLPIVAMTAHVLPLEQQLCRDAGMDGFLAKPIDPEAWFGLLERWLPLQARAAAGDVELVIEGIDTQAGINRCVGNFDLYRRLLLDFGERCPALGADLAAAADAENWPRVAFLAHALRGETGNLGIEDLSLQAGHLQKQPQSQELLARVMAGLQSHGDSLPARLEVPPDAPSAGGSPAEVAGAAARLREHLQNSQGESVDSLERFLGLVPDLVVAGRTRRLQTLVHQFEFSEALQELERLFNP